MILMNNLDKFAIGGFIGSFGTYYDFSDKEYKIYNNNDLNWIRSKASNIINSNVTLFALGYSRNLNDINFNFTKNLSNEFNVSFYVSNYDLSEIYYK